MNERPPTVESKGTGATPKDLKNQNDINLNTNGVLKEREEPEIILNPRRTDLDLISEYIIH